MTRPPSHIANMRVLLFTPIDWRHRATGQTTHIVGGLPFEHPAGLALCQDPTSDAVYLFYCNEEWEAVTDTWHESIDDAKAQASFEFSGTDDSWESP